MATELIFPKQHTKHFQLVLSFLFVFLPLLMSLHHLARHRVHVFLLSELQFIVQTFVNAIIGLQPQLTFPSKALDEFVDLIYLKCPSSSVTSSDFSIAVMIPTVEEVEPDVKR